jgi:glutamyl-tRNA synthetase
MEYERQGYLPEAMVNFLALLGWSPGDDREVMTVDELTARFALEGISTGNTVFNPEKLDWMNAQYIARLPAPDLTRLVSPLFVAAGLGDHPLVKDAASFQRLLDLLRGPLLIEPVAYDPEAVAKHLGSPELAGHVEALVEALGATLPFDETHVEATVRRTAAERELKAAQLIHATRVALTGRTVSPGLFELMAWLGPERTGRRLKALEAFLTRPD